MSTCATENGLQKAVVLVADDDPDIQRITQLNLVQEGFEVAQALSGVECLELVKSTEPDVILLDLMMPEMDGFETCKRLKSVDSTRDIPVIIVTALEELNDKLRCFAFKADDYVVKPYDFKDLLARIYLHLNRSIDLREREQKQRTAILRDVLRDLSETIVAHLRLIDEALDEAAQSIAPGSAAVIREANSEIIQAIETTREHEDPFYESPYIETDFTDDDDEDLEAILEEMPSPPDSTTSD
jgi:DNA-binding response OmpR family regulator